MGKIINKYQNDIDKCWYDSSNILYSECNDKTNALKEVKIVFKNGGTYLYKEVNVNDYLKFREDSSNGKGFIKYIRKYEFEKLDNSNVEDIKNELAQVLEEAQKSLLEAKEIETEEENNEENIEVKNGD